MHQLVFKGQQYNRGFKIKIIDLAKFGLNQIISESTHIMKNSSTCIDLLITSQINLKWMNGWASVIWTLSEEACYCTHLCPCMHKSI